MLAMSAITGIYHTNKEFISWDHCSNLMRVFEKYPADDISTWYADHIFLGCHAQWITPESIGERQPYYDGERRLGITADAIIDNRDELFDRLQVDKETRDKIPDSQLILLAYCKWGEESPKYLVGDFAFMIWDERNQQLFGARDFSGSRTLYYYHNQHRFVFSTLIQPLFTLPFIEKKLNEHWLAEFLANPGMHEAIDISSTVYKQIYQVLPSHSIRVKAGKVELKRYCTLKTGEKLKLKSNEEYEEAFREVFQKAVESRIRTHHRVGAHLSGGLDSGSVVSFASKALSQQGKKLYTYSYVPLDDFQDWTPSNRIANEKPFIQSTVKYVGNIMDSYLDFQGKSPLSEVDDWLQTFEMPYKTFENSFWIKGMFEEAHQEKIGVLLNGQRGNYTISWGPALDYYASLLRRLRLFSLYKEISLFGENMGAKKTRVLSVIAKKAFPFLNSWQAQEQHSFPELIHPDFAKKTRVFEKLQGYDIDISGSSISDIYQARRKHFEQLFCWNINGTLGTKLSLRYSLWDRDPTNDLRVVRFCLSVPEEQCVQDGLDRALIRRATKGMLPDEVRLNQRIRGIQGADGVHRMAPSWNNFIEEIQKLCKNSVISEFMNVDVIRNALLKLQEGPRPELAYDIDLKILMRSLILYRFIKNYT